MRIPRWFPAGPFAAGHRSQTSAGFAGPYVGWTAGKKVLCVRSERSVRVQCLRCGHVGVLTAETLSRLATAPSTLIAAFVRDCTADAAEVRV